MKQLAQITNPAIADTIGKLADQKDAAAKLAGFLAVMIRLALIGAAVGSLIYLLWGAFEWIVSGGDKGNIENAKNKITHAIIGLAIVAVMLAVFKFLGTVLEIDLLNMAIPTAEDIP